MYSRYSWTNETPPAANHREDESKESIFLGSVGYSTWFYLSILLAVKAATFAHGAQNERGETLKAI